MIVQEMIEGTDLIKSYSDRGMMMRQVETGILYGEAIDVTPLRYTYEETDIPVDPEDELSDLEERVDTMQSIIGEESDDGFYEPGQYIVKDGIMYRVLLPILPGTRITPGTNVEQTVILSEIANFNKEEN